MRNLFTNISFALSFFPSFCPREGLLSCGKTVNNSKCRTKIGPAGTMQHAAQEFHRLLTPHDCFLRSNETATLRKAYVEFHSVIVLFDRIYLPTKHRDSPLSLSLSLSCADANAVITISIVITPSESELPNHDMLRRKIYAIVLNL